MIGAGTEGGSCDAIGESHRWSLGDCVTTHVLLTVFLYKTFRKGMRNTLFRLCAGISALYWTSLVCLLRFCRPQFQEIWWHEVYNGKCLCFRTQKAVIVFPFQFFEIETGILPPYTMMLEHAWFHPCPKMFCLIRLSVRIGKAQEFASTYESGIFGKSSNTNCVFVTKNRLKMKWNIIVLQYINKHCSVCKVLDSENRGISFFVFL